MMAERRGFVASQARLTRDTTQNDYMVFHSEDSIIATAPLIDNNSGRADLKPPAARSGEHTELLGHIEALS
jgi:hypothetical protein